MSPHTTDTDADERRDTSQIVPPQVDTAPEVIAGLTFSDLKVLLPAGIATVVTLYGLLTGRLLLAAGAAVLAVGLALLGLVLKATARWYTTPRDRVEAWLSYLRRDQGEELSVLPEITGVDGVTEDGTARMTDGRWVAFVRVHGRNTALLEPAEQNDVASAFSTVIDEQIRDIPFRLFSTTRHAPGEETDVDAVAGRYEGRALDGEDDASLTQLQRDLLLDTADWLRDGDAPNWNAPDWHHYAVVEADAGAVRGNDRRSILARLNPLSRSSTTTVSDDRIRDVLEERQRRAARALDRLAGVRTESAAPEETVDVLRRHFGRGRGGVSELSADLVDEVVERRAGLDNADTDRLHRLTAPETFAPERGWVDLGEEYARTLWLAEYAREPESLWLKPLTTLRGVDVSLTVNVEPMDQEAALHELSREIADVDKEQQDRREEGDVSEADAATANDLAMRLRGHLQETPSRAWQASTYVTLRVRDEDALAAADEAVAATESFRGAHMDALDDATETAVSRLSQSPANAQPITPSVTQGAAFRAASPFTRDVWDRETREKAPKTRLVPGSVIGSMFPFATTSACEGSGIDFGRNEENGSHLRLSLFERGGAPHALTIGQTRSGKTYGVSKALLRWYLERDDRTLIVCDTQEGFTDLTTACDGRHVVVDGSQAVNPLQIEPPDRNARAAEEYRLTIEETVGFQLGLLEADGVADAGRYAPILAQAAERTLSAAGIDPERPATFVRSSPDLGDQLETLVDMAENPADYTWSSGGSEAEIHEQQIGELLSRLRSFQDGGKYAPLVGEDEIRIVGSDVDMAYLDLHALSGSEDAKKSAMLQLMLSQVRQKIKDTPGETIFLLDEAHVLLDNPRTADWLQKAAREFARYDAALWYVSQSPSDFVSGENESAARDTIRQQCSVIQLFRTPGASDETLAQFGLNEPQRDFVRQEAVRGKSSAEGEQGYSECLLDVVDIEGVIPTYVEAAELEHALLAGDLDLEE